LWLRAGETDVERAPVVFLGSEGEVATLALTPRAFLEQIAAGRAFYEYEGVFADESEHEPDVLEQVTTFVRERLGLDSLRDPAEIRAETAELEPEFKAWVERNIAHR
jgi:hypothetical protein